MTRNPPKHVVAALQTQVCPDLSVMWDEYDQTWHFTYFGKRQSSSLAQADGSVMLSLDGYTEAIVSLAHRSDQYRHFGASRKSIRGSRARTKRSAEAARLNHMRELRSPAKDRARFQRTGPKLISTPA
jgi:hypothetical protein